MPFFNYFLVFTTAFLAFILVTPAYFKLLRQLQWHEPLKLDNADLHGHKVGTLTSGGVLILLISYLVVLVSSSQHYSLTVALLGCIGLFCLVGFIDDGLKIKTGSGLQSKTKFVLLCIVSVIVYCVLPINLHFGYAALAFSLLVLVGASNAVNLTDGVDGLAVTTVVIALLIFSLSLMGLNTWFSHLDTLTVSLLLSLNCALLGACIGFLWFNKHPAQIFMGDSGSLALGGYLAILALLSQSPWSFILVGAVFVIEAISVIIQVGSFKLRGKRVFKRAPIHHHFEILGWSENTIVIRFSAIGLITGLSALWWF